MVFTARDNWICFDDKRGGISNNHIVDHLRHFHFIMTRLSSIEDPGFVKMLNYINENALEGSKIFIHIPRFMKDLKPCVDKVMSTIDFRIKTRVIVETYGPSFFEREKNYKHREFRFSYKDNKVNLIRIISNNDDGNAFDEYQNANMFGETNAFDTTPKMKYPEMFKDDIIRNFKRATPEKMLSSFKDDNDIWDYLTSNGTWTPSVDVVDEESDSNSAGE